MFSDLIPQQNGKKKKYVLCGSYSSTISKSHKFRAKAKQNPATRAQQKNTLHVASPSSHKEDSGPCMQTTPLLHVPRHIHMEGLETNGQEFRPSWLHFVGATKRGHPICHDSATPQEMLQIQEGIRHILGCKSHHGKISLTQLTTLF